jgi:hypothetical protein
MSATLTAVNSRQAAAVAAAERGWHVMAVKPNSKDPYFALAPRAHLSASNDPQTVADYFTRNKSINYGIAALRSGLIVLDFDRRNMGRQAHDLAERFADHPTYTVETADGWHLYYAATQLPANVPGKLCDGIDVKYRGYVVAAESKHPSGVVYTCTDDRAPAEFPLAVWRR